MRTIATYLPAIACGAMMLLICIPMMKSMHKRNDSEAAASSQEIAELREEIARLKAERALADTKESVDG